MSDNKKAFKLSKVVLMVIFIGLITFTVEILTNIFSQFMHGKFNGTSQLGDPGVASYFFQEGLRYERKGDYDKAIVSYQDEIKTNADNAAAYNALAWLYVDKLETNFDEAIILARTAVELTEDKEHPARDYWLANYLDTLGWAYYKNGDYVKAVDTLERAVALNSRESFVDHLETARGALNSASEPD